MISYTYREAAPLRPERFVTQKIIRAAARISQGSREKLQLGNIDILRDWGWSPDYVDAMWRMLQQEKADDFVIATGRTESLKYFVARAFVFFGLNWQDHVSIVEDLYRPSDIGTSRANPAKARDILGWSAPTDIDEVIRKMCVAAEVMGRQLQTKNILIQSSISTF